MRIFLIGFMGSGKTHWGRQLAAQLKIPFFDLDDEIEKKENTPVTRIFAEKGEEAFRIKEKETMEELIDTNGSMVLSCGGGTPCFFNNIERMKKYGLVIWLNTHIEILLERLLKEKTDRPLIRNIADEDMRSFIVRKLNERRIYYEQADVIIDKEDSMPVSEFIQTILHA
jgi:shikimate kinase